MKRHEEVGSRCAQSLDLMVNYLYTLHDVEDNHERFVHGEVVSARRITQRL